MKKYLLILPVLVTMASCDRNTPTPQIDPRVVERIVVGDQAPPPSISVVEAIRRAVPGESLTVVGRIAGASDPFSEDYATVIVADRALQTCERIPGDTCPTPWDACCVAPEEIRASRLLVQVTDAAGQPLESGLKGIHGLKELDEITVSGTVDSSSSPGNLILNAEAIYPTGSGTE